MTSTALSRLAAALFIPALKWRGFPRFLGKTDFVEDSIHRLGPQHRLDGLDCGKLVSCRDPRWFLLLIVPPVWDSRVRQLILQLHDNNQNPSFLRKRGMPLRRPHRRDNVTLLPLEIVMRKVFHTTQFMAGNSPAVRIPVSMAFPKQTKLVVIREGNRLI
ncbi:MAG: hypothetical protein M0Z43_01870, partial [Acidithiobacillus sp.]|nr:hypothetical protein [Acidithiobacillus sp.]